MVIAILRRPIAHGFAFKLFNITRVSYVVIHLLNTVVYMIGLFWHIPNSNSTTIRNVQVIEYNKESEEHSELIFNPSNGENATIVESSSSSSWSRMYLELGRLNCELTFVILRGVTIFAADIFGFTGAMFPKMKLFYFAFGFSCMSLVLSIMNSALFPSNIAKIDLDLDGLCVVGGIIMLREALSYIRYLNTIEDGINELRQYQNESSASCNESSASCNEQHVIFDRQSNGKRQFGSH